MLAKRSAPAKNQKRHVDSRNWSAFFESPPQENAISSDITLTIRIERAG